MSMMLNLNDDVATCPTCGTTDMCLQIFDDGCAAIVCQECGNSLSFVLTNYINWQDIKDCEEWEDGWE